MQIKMTLIFYLITLRMGSINNTSDNPCSLEFGAKEIYAGCTHGVLSGPAIERLKNSNFKEVVITNTIPLPKEKEIDKIKVLSIAPLFAEAIKRLYEHKAMGDLFEK